MTLIGNTNKYGIAHPYGKFQVRVDGEVIKKYRELHSDDTVVAIAKNLALGPHQLKIKYGHGPETASAVYRYTLLVE